MRSCSDHQECREEKEDEGKGRRKYDCQEKKKLDKTAHSILSDGPVTQESAEEALEAFV